MATKVGTGFVSIEPDFDQFDAKVRARLGALENEFKRVGLSAGDSFTSGFSSGRSSRELDTVRGKLSDVDREAKKASKSLGGIGSGGGGGGIRNTSRDLNAFGGAAAGATATIGGFRVALAALVPVTIGFGGAAVAAGASLIPLAGLAAAAGNALAAAAQGMGVFKLATAGVADALKEQVDKQGKAASAAISTAGQQRAAARSIQSAQDGLRDAVRSASDAVLEQAKAADAIAPAFTAARVRVNDLRQAVVDAGLSLRGAKLAAEDARQALADLVNGPDPRKLADAHHAITDAVRGEDSAVQALTDAHKALQDLLKPADALSVADATDAVADAVRNEERARLALNKQITETRFILQGGPGVTDDAQAQARLDLADAENAVGDATRQTEHAKEGLKKLEGPDQSAVEAARRKVTDAEEGVRRAAETTLSARKDLVDLEKPATSLELAKARLDVAQAENAVGDAERDRLRSSRDLAEAERLGISRAPEVVAARDALTKANRDVEDSERAVARAEQALGDAQLSAKEAMASAGLAAANLNEKFDKLPPAAQAFVRVLKDMKPRLDELRRTAAAGFFPGATEGLQAAAKNFDSVNKVVGETATVLGEAARKSGELVGSPAFGKDLETIGGRNAKVLDTLGEALRHVVSALRYVALAAGPLTQHLADLVNGWTKTAASSAKAGEESGRLAGFFEKTEAITRRLLSVLGHLGSGLLGVGKAGKDTGDDIWKSIDRAAGRFDEWANSAKGQTDLKDFFQKTKELAAALVPALSGVASGIAFLSLKALPLTATLKLMGPYADEATVAFVAYKVATLAAAAASNVAGFAVKAWAAGQWLLNAALAANPIVLIVAGLAALAAGLIYAYTHSETFRKIVDGALRAVGDAFTWMWNAAKDVFNWLKENWPLVLAILTGPIGLAVLEIVKHWDDIKRIFTDGVKAVIDGITAAAQWFIDAGKNMIRWIVDGIKSLASSLADAAGWVKNRIVEGLTALADAFKSAGTWVLNRVVEGFKTVTDLLSSVAGWLRNRIEEGIHNAIDGFKAIGSWVLSRLVDGFTTVTDALGAVGGWLKNRLVDLIGGAKDGFVSVGKSILGFIVDGMKSGGRLLLGFVNDIIDIVNSLLGAIGVDKIGHISAKSVGLAVEGHARGGAFARTGGIVDRPIVLMGEEAPTHPEFVIPTNPAYRDRAQALLMRAWGEVGFAAGGRYSKSDLAALWKRANGDLGDANLMAAIGLAESAGDPNASNGPYHGLWQVGPGGPYDPLENARAAGEKLRTQGLQAWEAYTNGTYKHFLDGDAGGGGLLGRITGFVGDLLSKGAGLILDKLPGLGNLPTWMKGIGSYLLDAVGGWVKNKVGDLVGTDRATGGGPDGIGTFEGLPMANWVIGALQHARRQGFTGHPTSGYRSHAENVAHGRTYFSEHEGTKFPHGAVDFGGFTTGSSIRNAFVAAVRDYKYPLVAPIGFRDDGHASGTGHKRGGIYGDDAPPFGGSFALGGIVPGPTGAPRLIEAHGGETVMPEGELRALVGELRALNASPTLDVIRALVGIVNTQQGRSARHRSMTAGLGGFPATP